MSSQEDKLKALISWSRAYRPEWDESPDSYVGEGLVKWAKSRRLGLLQLAANRGIKAYIGVQHIDPALPGWNIVDRPHTRFFVSLFIEGQCVALRTAPSMDAALELLSHMLRSAGVAI
jgi:hypothetical protein